MVLERANRGASHQHRVVPHGADRRAIGGCIVADHPDGTIISGPAQRFSNKRGWGFRSRSRRTRRSTRRMASADRGRRRASRARAHDWTRSVAPAASGRPPQRRHHVIEHDIALSVQDIAAKFDERRRCPLRLEGREPRKSRHTGGRPPPTTTLATTAPGAHDRCGAMASQRHLRVHYLSCHGMTG